MNGLYSMLWARLGGLWRAAREENLHLPLLRPVSPYAGPDVLSPFTALGVLIGLAVTAGIALTSLGVLLLSLLALYFLVNEVLGITVEIKPFPI